MSMKTGPRTARTFSPHPWKPARVSVSEVGVVGSDGTLVAWVRAGLDAPRNTVEIMANAHLLAASTKLLEGAKMALAGHPDALAVLAAAVNVAESKERL